MLPKVTVLMPVYNGESFLRATMESILEQTFTDFEFLIIDDGSTDSTVEIVRSFNDERIRLLRNPKRLKLSGALNRGLDDAQGEYIARMDGDDISLPFRLEKQVRLMDTSPEVGVCGAWVRRFGNERKEINRYPENAELIRSYALFDCPFAHPTVMLRKSFFDQHSLRYEGQYYPTEDYELWSRALDLFPGANIQEILLEYRVHDSSMTCSDWDDMDTKAAAIACTQLGLLSLHPSEEEVLIHRNIGRGESCRSKNIEELQQGEKWLGKLLNANREKKRYDEAAFEETLALIWFRFCFHAAPLGLKTLRCYWRSSLLQNDQRKIQRGGVLALSIIKNRLLNTKSV